MIAQAVYLLSENKELHDQLEQIYLSAMDFSMMDDVLESVVAQMIDFKIAREGFPCCKAAVLMTPILLY